MEEQKEKVIETNEQEQGMRFEDLPIAEQKIWKLKEWCCPTMVEFYMSMHDSVLDTYKDQMKAQNKGKKVQQAYEDGWREGAMCQYSGRWIHTSMAYPYNIAEIDGTPVVIETKDDQLYLAEQVTEYDEESDMAYSYFTILGHCELEPIAPEDVRQWMPLLHDAEPQCAHEDKPEGDPEDPNKA